MKNLKRIDEAVGTILERRASAEALLKAVIKGDTTEVEGIALSKQMAQGFLDWLQYSTYGKRFGALPFYKLFSAAFSWGLDRYVKGANTEVKGEFKELKAKAKSMKEANELNEGMSWNDIAKVMDAGLKKAIKKGSVPMSYAKDYVKSLERMAKRNAKKFFAEYGNFSEDDFIEDAEYNLANESLVTERDIVRLGKLDDASMVHKILKDEMIKNKISRTRRGDGEVTVYTNDIPNLKKLMDDSGISYELYESVINENDAKTIVKAFMNTYDKGDEVTADDWEQFIYDWAVMGDGNDELEDEIEYDTMDDVLTMLYKKGYKKLDDEGIIGLYEARFVKSYDKRLDNATTREEVSKLYPKAEFFVGKSDHFFGELEPNLFFKAYYTKGQKEFNIKSVYSKKGSNYIHLYNKLGESVVNESSSSEEKRIALRAIKSIAKYMNRDLATSARYLINAAEDVQRDIEKGKVK